MLAFACGTLILYNICFPLDSTSIRYGHSIPIMVANKDLQMETMQMTILVIYLHFQEGSSIIQMELIALS